MRITLPRISSVVLAVAGTLLLPAESHAKRLDLGESLARTGQNVPAPEVVDGDPTTATLVRGKGAKVHLVIDLGSESTLHRVYVTSRRDRQPPVVADERDPVRLLAMNVYVGNRPGSRGTPVATLFVRATIDSTLRVDANPRFQPATGRFVTLELNRDELTQPWSIAEVDLFGWEDDALRVRKDAVVLDSKAGPLRLAAAELSYYLGELEGRPVPIISPKRADDYPGTLYRIVDLAPLARSYEAMTNHLATGRLPSVAVNIEREGREIRFRAWPHRNVLWSVWEFLDRQGVRWLYPDALGEYVPEGRGVRQDVAPLAYSPPTQFIYANFGAEHLRDDPDGFLYFWRNRWTHTWGAHERSVLGGQEVPPPPSTGKPGNPDYAEGFEGYPHNFQHILPSRVLAKNPSWCGILTNEVWAERVGAKNLNRRLPPDENWCTFDMTSPGARAFVVQKAIAWWPEYRARLGNVLWLLPEDSLLFSEDEASIALRTPLADDPVPYVIPYRHSVSGDYFDFVCGVADGVREAMPDALVGAMAYSNTHRPPYRARPFPDNVLVDICLYGARNLPLTSPANAEMKRRLDDWSRIAPHRRHYDYDLIFSEKNGPLRMPVPLIAAMADRAAYFRERGMADGGTQAELETFPFNPWNYYAYPRLQWNPALRAEDVVDEFFDGYYREAAEPMKAYYLAAEQSLLARDVSLQAKGYDYGLPANAYPSAVLARMANHLDEAARRAKHWVVRERVRTAKEGFAWLLEQPGVEYAPRPSGR